MHECSTAALTCDCHCVILKFISHEPFCHCFINTTYPRLVIALCLSLPLLLHLPLSLPLFRGTPGSARAFHRNPERQRQMDCACAWTVGPKLSLESVRTWHGQRVKKIAISTCGFWLSSSTRKWTGKRGHILIIVPLHFEMLKTLRAPL